MPESMELSFFSICLRLILSMAMGGAIGIERVYKRRPAGFRTHMLVCLGASLTMILSQYQYIMGETFWASQIMEGGPKMDSSRYGAQVISGIGFLGAGTILITGQRQQIKGLTTAAGLWASTMMGLAIGAGFFQGALIFFLLLQCTIQILPYLETILIQIARDMTIYVEFCHVGQITHILERAKELGVQIYQIEVNQGEDTPLGRSSMVLSVHLPEKLRHEELIAHISGAEGLYSIEEL